MTLTRSDVDLMPDFQRDAVYKQMGWSLPTVGKRGATPKRTPTPRGMNKLESNYARFLDAEKHIGVYSWWAFEAIKLRLADGAFFKPDFAMIAHDGSLVFHETKGPIFREAAKVRIKVAAGLFPWRFVIVRQIRGAWDFEPVRGLADLLLSPGGTK